MIEATRARAVVAAGAGIALLGACSGLRTATAESVPAAVACPPAVAAIARCLGGRDSAGAHYLIAVPGDWNGRLVLHAHGGPTLGVPKAERAVEDLTRWAVTVQAGYAWAGTTFRQGGVAVRSAAEDLARLQRVFVAQVGQPKRTILHGQSWGAMVAAKAAEIQRSPMFGPPIYDAVLLTSGVLGGSRSYDVRLDLRVVYQYVCANHPRPDEPGYPLWSGLPADSTLTPAELRQRVNACLGLDRPAAERTPEQIRRTKTIVDVLSIPELSIVAHLTWATWHFQEIAQRAGGRSVFGNEGVRYRGSSDDGALNRDVLRYQPDASAAAAFAADTDVAGRIPVPVLTAHGIHDEIAFVEMETVLRDAMIRSGRGEALVQIFTDDRSHSYLSDPIYPALLEALLDWLDGGRKPSPDDVARRCAKHEMRFGAGCRVLTAFVPGPLRERVPERRPALAL